MKEAVLETIQRPLERTSALVLVHFLWLHKFEPNLIPGRGLAGGVKEYPEGVDLSDSLRQSDS